VWCVSVCERKVFSSYVCKICGPPLWSDFLAADSDCRSIATQKVAPGIGPRTSGLAARNSDHWITEAVTRT
jgi:hypothetical protein